MSRHFVPDGKLFTWGRPIARIVCPEHPGKSIGTVQRDVTGRTTIAVTSTEWRRGIIDRGPSRRRQQAPDVWEVTDLVDGPDRRSYCGKCGWLEVSIDRTRAAVQGATPRRPATVVAERRTAL